MRKIIMIIGGRPQIIKAHPLISCITKDPHLKLVKIYTGQHYTKSLSTDLLEELGITNFEYYLRSKRRSGAQFISFLLSKLDEIIKIQKPLATIVFGDMDTTLAGAIASARNNVPIVHIEAGIRSHNQMMVEEQNRIITDHLSTILIAPTKEAVKNLYNEGIGTARNGNDIQTRKFVVEAGDIMLESLMKIKPENAPVNYNNFGLLTVHRAENTTSFTTVEKILNFVVKNSTKLDAIIFPAHPRTEKIIRNHRLDKKIKLIKPLSYKKNIELCANSKIVFTDSGGLQKEACWLGKPCVVLRKETEWPDLIKSKRAVLMRDYNKNFKFNLVKEKMDRETSGIIHNQIYKHLIKK